MDIIDRKMVKHVALLSRLELSAKELTLYSSQLASIVTYIRKLNELNTDDTPPTSHVLTAMKDVERADEPRRSLEVEEVLKNAPEREGDFFRIPKVIEGR